MVIGKCKFKELFIHDSNGKHVATISDDGVKLPMNWKASAILEESATNEFLMTLSSEQALNAITNHPELLTDQ